MKNLFCILVVGAVLEMGTSQSKQCLTIDFESFENTNPTEGLLISDQFLNQFGVTFELENGSYPVLARTGSPQTAFSSMYGSDTPAPNQNIGTFFITDDGKLLGLQSIPLIVRFNNPVDSVSAIILDMDFDETFTVEARDEKDVPIFTKVIKAGDNLTGDGLATPFGFNLEGCVGAIYSLKFVGKRNASGSFGLGMDNFSFCFSGIDIESNVAIETTNVNCITNTGTLSLINNSDINYQYSLDGSNYYFLNDKIELQAGEYTITIIDDNDCNAEIDISIDLPPSIEIMESNKTDTKCGENNGIINIEAQGVDLTYKINEEDFTSNSTFSNLAPGRYTITIKDIFDCLEQLNFEILSSEPIILKSLLTDKEICNKINGSVTLEVNNNEGLRIYINDVEINGKTLNNLKGGMYKVYMDNIDGCKFDTTFVIETTPPILLMDFNTTPTDCQKSNGIFNYSLTGGTGNISVLFDNNNYFELQQTITDLPYGSYELYASDELGCELRNTIEINRNTCPVYIPNIINASSLNNNNLFSLITYDNYDAQILDYVIYDRWGSKIFEATDFSIHNSTFWWNGYFNNMPAETDVYVYMVNILHPNGEVELRTGDVTLLK